MRPYHAVIDVPDAPATADKDVKAPLLNEKAPVPAAVVQDTPRRRSNATPALALLLATAVLLGLASLHMYGDGCPHHAAANRSGGNSQVATFLAELETSLTEKAVAANEFGFAYESNITDANLKASTEASLALSAATLQFVQRAKQLDTRHASKTQRRQLDLLNLDDPVLSNPAEQEELKTIIGRMSGIYGSATVNGLALEPDLTEKLATVRDYDELAKYFMGWRDATGPKMRNDYTRFMQLANKAARENGFPGGLAEQWLAGYDMPVREMEELVEDLWDQVLPLYQQLHCHVRRQLQKQYGASKFPKDSPLIPAHLLGNMWAQAWGNIANLVVPFPDLPNVDVTPALKQQGYDAIKMHKLSESFYKGLGFDPLPATFWTKSMLTKPKDRDAICHASAWDIDPRNNDLRIKMCTVPTHDELRTVHHEQGHLYYDHAYRKQPYLFRTGAADFFHEAIGDTIALAVVVPKHLRDIGLLPPAKGDQDKDTEAKQALNFQMHMALDKIAFLPFGLLVDKWRWDVSRGLITPDNYTSAWWEYVKKYQGLVPPVPRGAEADAAGAFDAGAKFHVASNTPYLRYFGAHILQFQLYDTLCAIAGHEGPLHECTFAGSKKAGDAFQRMLALGRSRTWQDALGELTNGKVRELDPSSMMRYFAPLIEWLRVQNEGQTCAW
ncbi:hypothetical protein GGF32_006312 [Allomyces javanicus]|nr:hypothetical protein GGF32_006312 [Allomyces javanicus]